jgi:GTPase SAR1 family protein
MAKYNAEYFKKQFEDLPPNAMAIIASRAAMRVLPVLAYRQSRDHKPFAYWKEGQRAQNALAAFRGYHRLFSLTESDTAARYLYESALNAAHRASADSGTARNVTMAILCANYAADAEGDVAQAANMASSAADFASHAFYFADAYSARDANVGAILSEIELTKSLRNAGLSRPFRKKAPPVELAALLVSPLWPKGEPKELSELRSQLEADLRSQDSGFEIWIDWYRDRLVGKPVDWEIERQWALLSKEQLSQSPAEINAYLKALRERSLTKELKRVRAIFIGHGEAGKTSLIRALHGEDVILGREAMTHGIAIKDAALSAKRMEEEAGVFTSVTDYKDDDLTVHFWDFGGQVMAHATHQFFLRSQWLYVIVLAGRAERNPNEEAEYWLEHVRAFGDGAPVLLVGNKADVMPVNLDLATLAQKFPNIVGFYPLSCTQAKGAFKDEFELFRKKFEANLKALGQKVQRFSPEQFKVLKAIEQNAAQDDFLNKRSFDEICKANRIALKGPGVRATLLDIFDKLGIVMHFDRLPYLDDFVLNPRWLTYRVYTIMYSKEAKAAKGRLSEPGLVKVLKKANPSVSDGRALRYPAGRCAIIANAMIAFQVAYRLGSGELVIPALLAPEQPDHDFRPDTALAFRFDFGGFLPRHVLPALIVAHFQDIANKDGREIVWQNGVHF